MQYVTAARLALAGMVAVIAVGCSRAQGDMDGGAQSGTDLGMDMGLGAAEYTVVLKSTWTAANHPYEYPPAGVVSGPHFSGLIGASHNGAFSLFAEGSPPTPGLEKLSEEGKHAPLDQEIRGAVSAGRAGALFETAPLRDFRDSLVTTVRVDEAHPLVSLVAMIAPSPDWFAGVRDVNLVENGAWVDSRSVDLIAFDSGGDDGATYRADDRDANPKKPTAKAMTRHFVVNGVAVPVGTVQFTKK